MSSVRVKKPLPTKDIIVSETVGECSIGGGMKQRYYARRWHQLKGESLQFLYPLGAWADQVLLERWGQLFWVNLRVRNGRPDVDLEGGE